MTAHDDGSPDTRAETEALRAQVLPDILMNVTFDGWTDRSMADAVSTHGLDPAVLVRIFPDGLADVLDAFAAWADAQMLAAIEEDREAFDGMKVRDRIRAAVLLRLEVLSPYKDAVRRSLALLGRPALARQASRSVWRTADAMWYAAGDTATDFNHYSKRALLSGVLTSTTLYWLNDDSPDAAPTQAFLDRRIEEVLFVGGRVGRVAKPLGRVTEAPFRLAGRLRERLVGRRSAAPAE